ncbi:hypothetical protein BOTBODRAFT_70738 [Botryobasidium botryosum FD-172 SS1]|uniref:Uncharacterized protein n=1 Tax=Botryobasidium botryosum (strain FD-172 SS1) TaxID=930990 RepID=A0A067M5L6_BOTB1|nr:hypothetical protein BOTBODRAFT_70738 [Botryobasidium botryosum FD-172 SS1]
MRHRDPRLLWALIREGYPTDHHLPHGLLAIQPIQTLSPSSPSLKLPEAQVMGRRMNRHMAMSPPESPEDAQIIESVMKIQGDMRHMYDHKVSPDEFRRNTLPDFQKVMGIVFERFLTHLEGSDPE